MYDVCACQDNKEEYFVLKLFQICIYAESLQQPSICIWINVFSLLCSNIDIVLFWFFLLQKDFFIPKEKVTIQPGASRLSLTHTTSIDKQREVNGFKQPESPPRSQKGDTRTPSPVEQQHPGVESSPSPPSDPERQSITSQSSIMSHGSFDSDIGAVKPELYARKDEKLVLSHNGEPVKGKKKIFKRGNIHMKLQYDFDKSDFVVRILEGERHNNSDFAFFCVWTNETSASSPYAKLFSLAKTLQRSGT